MSFYDNGGRADYNYPNIGRLTESEYQQLSLTIDIRDIPLECPYELVNGQIAYDLCDNFSNLTKYPDLWSEDVRRMINVFIRREFFVITDNAAWKDWRKHPIYEERCRFDMRSVDEAFTYASGVWFILHGIYILDDPDMEVLLRIQNQLHDTRRMCKANRTLTNEHELIKVMMEECGRVDDIMNEAWEKQKRSESKEWTDWNSRTLQEMEQFLDSQPFVANEGEEQEQDD